MLKLFYIVAGLIYAYGALIFVAAIYNNMFVNSFSFPFFKILFFFLYLSPIFLRNFYLDVLGNMFIAHDARKKREQQEAIRRAEEEQKKEEERRKKEEEERKLAIKRAQEERKRQEERRAQEERKREEERLVQEERKRQEEKRAQEERKRQEEKRAQEERNRQEERRAQEEHKRQEERRAREEQKRQEERRAREEQKQQEERRAQEERKRQEEKRIREEREQREKSVKTYNRHMTGKLLSFDKYNPEHWSEIFETYQEIMFEEDEQASDSLKAEISELVAEVKRIRDEQGKKTFIQKQAESDRKNFENSLSKAAGTNEFEQMRAEILKLKTD